VSALHFLNLLYIVRCPIGSVVVIVLQRHAKTFIQELALVCAFSWKQTAKTIETWWNLILVIKQHHIAVEDRMFLGMQDIDFAQNILVITQNLR